MLMGNSGPFVLYDNVAMFYISFINGITITLQHMYHIAIIQISLLL